METVIPNTNCINIQTDCINIQALEGGIINDNTSD